MGVPAAAAPLRHSSSVLPMQRMTLPDGPPAPVPLFRTDAAESGRAYPCRRNPPPTGNMACVPPVSVADRHPAKSFRARGWSTALLP